MKVTMARKRAVEVIVSCSQLIPAGILSKLCGLTLKEVSEIREANGVRIASFNKLAASFKQQLPDPELLPLNMEERRRVAFLRQRLLAEGLREMPELDTTADLIKEIGSFVPAEILAEVFETSRENINHIRLNLGVSLARSEAIRLSQVFASRKKCPQFDCLNESQTSILEREWERVHKRLLESRARRRRRSKHYPEKKFNALKRLRNRMCELEEDLELCQCSGDCGESWPRTASFFMPNLRSNDGLGKRCEYCRYVRTRAARKRKDGSANKKRGLVYLGQNREHLKKVISNYGQIIPGEILRLVYGISQNSLENLRIEVGARLSREQSTEVDWRWYFLTQMPLFPMLGVKELARMMLVSKAWKQERAERFERNMEQQRSLLNERAAILSEAWKGPGSVRPEEQSCKKCGLEFPITQQFFKKDKKGITSVCKVCANHDLAKWRLRKLREKHGQHESK